MTVSSNTAKLSTVIFLAIVLVSQTNPTPPVQGAPLLQVPFFHDYWGTGPTTGMMILAYLDQHGYPGIIPGDTFQQTQALNDLIASPEHIADFAYPLDTPGHILPDRSQSAQPFTPDGSLANLMFTSQSQAGNATGYTYLSNMWFGVERWAQNHQPGFQFDVCYGHFCDTRMDLLDGQKTTQEIFTQIRANLDAGWPLAAVLGPVADPGVSSDSYVVIVGYQDGATPQLAYLDPKDNSMAVHWRAFGDAQGTVMGFGAVLYFKPQSLVSGG